MKNGDVQLSELPPPSYSGARSHGCGGWGVVSRQLCACLVQLLVLAMSFVAAAQWQAVQLIVVCPVLHLLLLTGLLDLLFRCIETRRASPVLPDGNGNHAILDCGRA
jgi:hypothetical protein